MGIAHYVFDFMFNDYTCLDRRLKNNCMRKEMPIYEFQCEGCYKISERIVPQGVKIVECDHCGDFAHKIISAGSFKINGYSESNGYSKGGKK